MRDSNWTLRFNRSAREAYGHDIVLDDDHDSIVAWVFVFVWGFIIGFVSGAAIV
jgi:hypothetical protein